MDAYTDMFPGVKRPKHETNFRSPKRLRILGAVTSTPHIFVECFLLEHREDFKQKLT
jgi:hypothetical protein